MRLNNLLTAVKARSVTTIVFHLAIEIWGLSAEIYLRVGDEFTVDQRCRRGE